MSTNCVITFDHLNGIYNSGDILNGHIRLHTTKPKFIRGIYIKISGYADVEWEQRKTRRINLKTEYYSVYYKTHEQYLNSITYVVGEDCGDSFDLLPGIYVQTFNCTLPRELPTTCNELYGKIKYEVSVIIDRPLKYHNIFTKSFKVNHCVDLNRILGNQLPIVQNEISAICCLSSCICWGSGEVHAKLKIPFGGIIAGKNIPFTLFIKNDTILNINNCKVKFKKIMTFESTTPEKQCKKIIIDLDTKLFNSVLRLSDKEVKDFIEIPNELPCTQHGKCIRIEYFIKGTVYTGCCGNEINLEIPVTIGSIPFNDETDIINDETIITTQPTAMLSENVDLLVNNSLDLPTYEDAIQMTLQNNAGNFKSIIINLDDGMGLATAPPDFNSDSVVRNLATDQIATSSSDGIKNYGWT